MTGFTIVPRGPFSLAAARDFAGGFAAGIGAQGHGAGILMAFPVEGWQRSAAVDAWQEEDGTIQAVVSGNGDMATVERQAARSLSLDHDGSGCPRSAAAIPLSALSRSGSDFSVPSASTRPTRRPRRSSSASELRCARRAW